MIRATIVLLAAHLIVPKLRRLSAAERHLLWAACLAIAALLPILSVVLPAWRPAWADRLAGAWPDSIVPLPSWALTAGPDVIVRPTGIEATTGTLIEWGGALWVFGSLVALIRLALEVVKLRRLLSTARRLADDRCRRMAIEVAHAIRLECSPLLLHSPDTVIPMTWGARRPRVLLPESAHEWSDERLRAVLTHELAHVRRHDWLVHMAAQVACAAYWFHPLFWMAERWLCRESEHAADDEVLRRGIDDRAYASHLVDIVRASRTFPPRGGVVAMARASHLECRVIALLETSAHRRAVRASTAAVAAVLTALVAVPLAALTNQSGLPVEVIVRTLDLPATLPSAIAREAMPGVPAVRYVAGAGGAIQPDAAIVAPTIAEYTTPPLYSDEARRRRIEGIVTIGGRVDERGRLTDVRVIGGLGFGLDQNALVAVRQWRFNAGTRHGVPAAMDAAIDIEFSLETEAVNELIANDMATLVGPGVTPPRLIRTSGASPSAGARGSVVLDVVLLEDGSPKILRILQSLSPEADDSAVRHFEQWRFSPAMKAGVPVKVRMNAEVRFHG